jgi:hypothetical protein
MFNSFAGSRPAVAHLWSCTLEVFLMDLHENSGKIFENRIDYKD